MLPFEPEFHFREHVEIADGHVRSVGRVGSSGHVLFCQELPHNERCVCRCIVMMQQPVSILPHLRQFASHIFPQSSQNLAVKLPIDSLTSWNKLLMHNSLKVQKMICIDLMLLGNLCTFSVAERMASSIAKTAVLFPGHNHIPMIHLQL